MNRTIPAREVAPALQRKVFLVQETHHTRFIYYTSDGRKSSIHTKISHSHKEISTTNIKNMAEQCKLTTQQFVQMIACTISKEQYEQILIKGEYIRFSSIAG